MFIKNKLILIEVDTISNKNSEMVTLVSLL